MISLLNESVIAKTEKKIYDFLPHEPQTMATTLFIIGMSAYYLWRMFAITPNYNELYSYVNYISNGPLHAALNWGVPENHVGYSLVASLLYYLGNSYIALRGVSFLCAIANLILVYRICARYYAHGLPFAALVLYASMQVVNEYSVQGRGYTLATFCFLGAVYVVGVICRSGEDFSLRYGSFALFCIIGIYTIPGSINWVVPTSMTVMIFLFINGFRSRAVYASDAENIYLKKLNRFLGALFGIIVVSGFLYSALWLSIGSGIMNQDSSSQLFGAEKSLILVRSPVQALGKGVTYMASNDSYKEVASDMFKSEFGGWIKDLFDYMLPGLWWLVAAFVVIGIIIMIAECFRHFEYSRTSLNLLVIINIFYIVAVLISTHNLPKLKGFGYGSFIAILCFCSCMEKLINAFIRYYNRIKNTDPAEKSYIHNENEKISTPRHWYSGLSIYIPTLLVFILFIFRVFDPKFSEQLGARENEIFNTMYIADMAGRKNPAVLDCDQYYLLKFGWNYDCQKNDVTDSDCIILDRKLMNPGYDGEDAWKFYQSHEQINWEYLDSMHIEYENDEFVLYTKK